MAARALSESEIVEAAPRFLKPYRDWSGMCEAAAFNLANVLTPGYVPSFPTATAARLASRIEGPGFGPGGNWVWMKGVWGVEGGKPIDYGHVAYHVGGGLLFMASSSVRVIPGFTALGFIDGPTYMRRFSGQTLVGWSWDHGGTIIEDEDDDMAKYTDQDQRDLQDTLKLVRELHAKADNSQRREESAAIAIQAVADKVNSLGMILGSAVQRAVEVVIEIGTREGKAGRTYGDLQTRQVVYISDKARSWREIVGTDPDGKVIQLSNLGWAQRGIKWLEHGDFIEAMREANRTFFQATNPIPWYLTGDANPSASKSA